MHLGEQKTRLFEAEQAGVKSVPALALGEQTYHIDFGAGLDALK